MRVQFPSRLLGLMIHEALLFPSHIFYPLGTLCTGHGFGVYMPPRGWRPRVTGVGSRLRLARTFTWSLHSSLRPAASGNWAHSGSRDPMIMCPPSHLLTKMHALPHVTMSSLGSLTLDKSSSEVTAHSSSLWRGHVGIR